MTAPPAKREIWLWMINFHAGHASCAGASHAVCAASVHGQRLESVLTASTQLRSENGYGDDELTLCNSASANYKPISTASSVNNLKLAQAE